MIPETPVGAGPAGRDTERHRSPAQDQGRAPFAVSVPHVLRFLAAALRARAAVEVGAGAPDSVLWLLRGMADDGVLTSIDVDATRQRAVRAALREEGVGSGRTRLIAGVATEVLPRLTEGGYDLVSVATPAGDHVRYLELGLRLLRPGGVIVFSGLQLTAQHGTAAALAVRELRHVVEEDTSLVPVALPVGRGLLAVTKQT
ncbi:class I SAM-dependent methyltransferase [Saccharopolyspora sp. HNM0983]|uniref:Class I SAM-dependent methyltransferase n=1 Tax=Saccharopolyspora montiporae TaxID=2781240 RepID=A0A929BBB2_9PSEU|nr:class I SAM-dependent methyltransferase [Saccharopolyspora sp. HNM0983]